MIKLWFDDKIAWKKLFKVPNFGTSSHNLAILCTKRMLKWVFSNSLLIINKWNWVYWKRCTWWMYVLPFFISAVGSSPAKLWICREEEAQSCIGINIGDPCLNIGWPGGQGWQQKKMQKEHAQCTQFSFFLCWQSERVETKLYCLRICWCCTYFCRLNKISRVGKKPK